jgi:tripartite-type tricarboxylate transporter receptor subunit TctC
MAVSRNLSAIVLAAALLPGTAISQAYPSKPIRLIVPFPAGGGVDYIGRIVGKGLAERLGQQVIVDNRPGANAIVGLEVLKSSPADGYTIAAASAGPLAVNPFIYAKMPHDTVRDFTYIAKMVIFPLLLVSHPSLPVKNVKELIALARARPNEIS